MDYTKTTLGELLSSDNETIKRNAVSILKQYQKRDNTEKKLKEKGLKIIKITDEYINWERDDGLQCRVWDFAWK